MKLAEYAAADATELALLIEAGQVTAREVEDAARRAIELLNPEINAVIHLNPSDRSGPVGGGALTGVPLLLKDLGAGNRAGEPYTWGTRFLRDAKYTAPVTSNLVRRFESAGLSLLGHTNVPELGPRCTTEPDAFGATRNPWDVTRSPGGSSGGAAAAVASGMVPAAHASDGGGSIRMPASVCGLVGLKPSRGRVSSGPSVGEAWAGMSCEFAVTRTVRDAALLLDVVHGLEPGDPYVAPAPWQPYVQEVGADPGTLRIGLLTERDGVTVHPACIGAAERVAALLERMGHHVEVAGPPGLRGGDVSEATMIIVAASAIHLVKTFEQALGRPIGPDDVDADNWGLLDWGRQWAVADYVRALDALNAFTREVASWWASGFDLLVTPTTAQLAPSLGDLIPNPDVPYSTFLRSGEHLAFLGAFNITGQPAISVPAHEHDGLPVGVQLVAGYGREDLLIRVASALEAELNWASRTPKVHVTAFDVV